MKKSQAAILGALIVFWGVWASSAYKNKSVNELQSRVEKEVNAGIQTAKTLPLETAGGVTWDYVCFVAHDTTGTDVADGASVAKNALRDTSLDFPTFAVASRDYNELSKDWTHGLVFVSAQKKLLIAIALDGISSAAPAKETCARAQSASLSTAPAADKGRQITFTGSLK